MPLLGAHPYRHHDERPLSYRHGDQATPMSAVTPIAL